EISGPGAGFGDSLVYFGDGGQVGLNAHDESSSSRVRSMLSCFDGPFRSRGPTTVPSERKLRARLPRSSTINSESPKVPYRSNSGRRSCANSANSGQLYRYR